MNDWKLSDAVKAATIGVKKLTAILSFQTTVYDNAPLFSTPKRQRISADQMHSVSVGIHKGIRL